MTVTFDAQAPARLSDIESLSLDLTRKCQLACTHCYNASGPDGRHGTMSRADWLNLVDEAAAYGIRDLQLIGGEPTLHPDAADVAKRALDNGLTVEVYSNLVHVTGDWWEVFRIDGVRVATSYYGADDDTHNRVTGRPSRARTEANIVRALALGIRLRVGIVRIHEDQDVEAAVRHLNDLGVRDIRVDDQRPLGRAGNSTDPAALCGRCGTGRAAVGPDGTVTPCTLAPWMRVGSIHDAPLADVLNGEDMAGARRSIRDAAMSSKPKRCDPNTECTPGFPGSECDPRN